MLQMMLKFPMEQQRTRSWAIASNPTMEPVAAERLYEAFFSALRRSGLRVEAGRFRAMMRVRADNDGPVTILIDSRKLF